MQGLLLPEGELADSQSCFRIINGVQVHYKVQYPTQTTAKVCTTAAVALYHGFGASSYSWASCQVKHLACNDLCSSQAVR